MNVVLIPAYEPDTALIQLVDQLYEDKFKIVVVDDGSGADYANIFSVVKEKADIVTLPKNCGKGAALKAGMAYIRDNIPECQGFITCDADGQHRPEDVSRVSQQLNKGEKFVLTIRERKGEIPLRSRFGNDLSRIVYTLLTNRYLSDNQSGLRGFHISNLEWLVKVEKSNYDYEMNVLYYAAKMGLKITTIPIDAIYIENNVSSHFNPVKDTIRIYKSLFSLAKGTFLSFLLAEVLVLLFGFIFGTKYIGTVIPSVGAVSLLFCVLLNKFVFLKHISIGSSILTTVVYTIISYFVYTLMCVAMNLMWPGLPLFVIFNLVYFFCLPLRFFLHQLIFIGSITKE
jgi:glycosyltransferase involved in cell wall biosynthesis